MLNIGLEDVTDPLFKEYSRPLINYYMSFSQRSFEFLFLIFLNVSDTAFVDSCMFIVLSLSFFFFFTGP